jgi:TolB protein
MTRCLPGLLVIMLWTAPVGAVLEIEISGGVEGALPIAVVPFGWIGEAPGAPEPVGRIIAADLRRSGQFAPLPEADLFSQPHDQTSVNYADWRAVGVDKIVVGRTQAGPDEGRFTVQFQLLDVFTAEQIVGYSFPARREELRAVAHHIADIIYEQLTGTRGAFATRIAYVTAERVGGESAFSLTVADSDGHDPRRVLESGQPLMSPAWSPDGERIAYVSFETGRSRVYVQELATGARQQIAAFPGVNGAPAFSPDGRSLALTLSKDGDLEIYILDLVTSRLTRVTDNPAIDTEPVWTPDGGSIVFTSDRGGRPQLYRVAIAGGRPTRLTFEGDYNARPRISPDGHYLAMVHGDRGRYRIAVMDLESGALRTLTEGPQDESPSFAPNGVLLLYASQERGRGVLAGVSLDGRVRQRLRRVEGEVREPAWSPFLP